MLIAPTLNTPSTDTIQPWHRSKAKNAYPTACSAKRFNLRKKTQPTGESKVFF